MRILLIGEYSGFFTNLKKGFVALGHDVVLAANDDGWKKIGGADIPIYGKGNNFFKDQILFPLKQKKKLVGFDLAIFVNPILFHLSINKNIFKYIISHSKRSAVCIAGDGFSLYSAYKKGIFPYYIYDNNESKNSKYKNLLKNWIMKRNEQFVFKKTKHIISVMYEYAVGVRNNKYCNNTIPLPFDVNSVKYSENRVKDKIIIYHGIIRREDKGRDYIEKALHIIEEKYPDKVSVIISPKKPLSEYLSTLSTVNIVVDQCKELCYGMNALYAMAMGKIVLGGASMDSLKEYELNNCPVIHIEPNVDQIVSQIEMVLSKASDFPQMGFESRSFVETFHNSKRIAGLYINTLGLESK